MTDDDPDLDARQFLTLLHRVGDIEQWLEDTRLFGNDLKPGAGDALIARLQEGLAIVEKEPGRAADV